jgi:hypothetical protein
MDPAALKFLLDEIGKKFDEAESRLNRRLARLQQPARGDTPSSCSNNWGVVPFPIQSATVRAEVVADNWGDLFGSGDDSDKQRDEEPIIADNWGGLFEQSAQPWEERDFGISYATTPSAAVSSTDEVEAVVAREIHGEVTGAEVAPQQPWRFHACVQRNRRIHVGAPRRAWPGARHLHRPPRPGRPRLTHERGAPPCRGLHPLLRALAQVPPRYHHFRALRAGHPPVVKSLAHHSILGRTCCEDDEVFHTSAPKCSTECLIQDIDLLKPISVAPMSTLVPATPRAAVELANSVFTRYIPIDSLASSGAVLLRYAIEVHGPPEGLVEMAIQCLVIPALNSTHHIPAASCNMSTCKFVADREFLTLPSFDLVVGKYYIFTKQPPWPPPVQFVLHGGIEQEYIWRVEELLFQVAVHEDDGNMIIQYMQLHDVFYRLHWLDSYASGMYYNYRDYTCLQGIWQLKGN